MATAPRKTNQDNLPVKTSAQKFTEMVIREFSAMANRQVSLTPYQQHLAQNLFLKVDETLKALEAKRVSSGKDKQTPITWENVNLNKLAIDAVHRIDLGLDALIPNHIHPIPYFNGKEKKYDLDLRIGYAGRDYYRRQAAVEQPVDIIYELVYKNDHFRPIKRSFKNDVESYEFEIKNPWDRGEIVGGFGYIMYADPRKNQLITVSEADFRKSQSAAKSNDFWSKFPVEMRFKTLVHRVTSKLPLDPRKITDSYKAVDAEDQADAAFREEVAVNANTGEIIDVEPRDEGSRFTAGDTPGATHPYEPDGEEPMVTCPENGDRMKISYCENDCRARNECPAHQTAAAPDPGF